MNSTFFEANKRLWNEKTDVHLQSAFYAMPAFLEGSSSLKSIELEQLGSIDGLRLLHLQCHFGQDTLSLARMGAQVTGVDISDKAIQEAQRLSSELQLPARFICCNIYDLSAQLGDTQFDVIFTSYGALPWLPDLKPWAALIARHLKPGGVFHLVEFHPVVWMFDNYFERVEYTYFNSEVIEEEIEGTYADYDAAIGGKSYTWNHDLGEVIGALLQEGLQISQFRELDYSPYPCFPKVIESAPGQFQIPGLEGKIPMVYALKATKPA